MIRTMLWFLKTRRHFRPSCPSLSQSLHWGHPSHLSSPGFLSLIVVVIISRKLMSMWNLGMWPYVGKGCLHMYLRISRRDHPGLLRWALSPKTNVLIKGEGETQTASWRHVEAEIGVMLPQTKKCQGHQKLEETRRESSPRAFRGLMALPTPVFWTSSLQNREKVNFHHFKLIGLRQFAKAAREN